MNDKDAGDEDETGCVNVERQASSSSTSSVLCPSPQRHQTVTPSSASVGALGSSATPTSGPGGRGFDLVALQEAISLATASSLRFGPPPPAVSELLHYGAGLRGIAHQPSSTGCPSRPPGWVYPPPATSRYNLTTQQLDVKTAGFAPHQIRDGGQTVRNITTTTTTTTTIIIRRRRRSYF